MTRKTGTKTRELTKTPGKVGHPPVKIDTKEVERLAGLGLSDPEIAACMGFSGKTLLRHKTANEAVADALVRGRAREHAELSTELNRIRALLTKVETGEMSPRGILGPVLSAILTKLERRFGWIAKQTMELTGADGGPVKTQAEILGGLQNVALEVVAMVQLAQKAEQARRLTAGAGTVGAIEPEDT